jgi:hypothetical protein
VYTQAEASTVWLTRAAAAAALPTLRFTGHPCRFMARSDYAFVFHAFALLFYVRTWMWHLTPAAAILPGAQGFGWFFR